MDTTNDCKHELVDHGLTASAVAAESAVVIAADDNEIDLVDNSIHFDSANHPENGRSIVIISNL